MLFPGKATLANKHGKSIAILVTLGLVLSLGLMTLPAASAIAASPAVIYVSEGDSIQAAIDAAAPGDTIIVQRGTYTESLTIDKSLTVRSSSGADSTAIDGTVTIDLEDQETAVFGGSRSGFTVTGASPGIEAGVAYWSSLSIVGNELDGTTEDGILINHVRYFGQLEIRDNTITGNGENGINISGNVQYHSSVAIVDNRIIDNINNGIYLNHFVDTGELLIEGNTISGNEDGVYFQGDIQSGSQCLARGNDISGNIGYGLRFNNVQYGSYLAVLDNTINNNTDDGVFIWWISEGAEGLIEDNTIEGNVDDGIFIHDGVNEGSSLVIRDNTISRTESIAVTDQAVGTGDDSETTFYLAGEERRVTPGSETVYLDGTPTTAYTMSYPVGVVIFDTAPGNGEVITADYAMGGWGIYHRYMVSEGSDLEITNNQVTENDADGVFIEHIDEGSDAIIHSNTISDNGGYGSGVGFQDWYQSVPDWQSDEAMISEGSSIALRDNEITGNGRDGIYIYELEEGCRALIEDNTITGNDGCGFRADQEYSINEGSRVTLRDNQISSNTDDGIFIALLDEGCQVLIEDNAIRENDDGIQIMALDEGSQALIEDNTIAGNLDDGIYVGEITMGSQLAVVDNRITDNTDDGVWVDQTDSGSEVTVSDNTISENGETGLYLGSDNTLENSKATVRGNTISENGEWGITLHAVHSMVSISGNGIRDNGSGGSDQGGIYVDGSQLDLVAIHRNNIAGNTEWGLNNDSGEMIDAEDNWWGDASGPEDPAGSVEVPDCTDDPATELNSDGTGDKVSDNVDYCPWLTSPTTITTRPPTIPGPTPTEWQVPGDFATIQGAIDNAAGGDIIIVHPDTYTESLSIDKSLTVYSTDGADSTTIEGTVTIELTDDESVVFGGSDAGFEVNATSPGFDVSVEYWSQLTIEGNRIAENTDQGIYVNRVWYGSSLSVLDNEISDNTGAGILIDNGIVDLSQGLIRGNAITGNADGIYVNEATNQQNEQISEAVTQGSRLEIIGNEISDSTGNGIFIQDVAEGSQALIEDNAIRQSRSTQVIGEAVGTGDGFNTDFNLDNRQTHFRSETIYLDGTPTTDYTIVYTTGEVWFDTAPGLNVAITADYVAGGWGIQIGRYGVTEGSSLTIRDNRVSDNDSDGIYIDELNEGSQAFIGENTINGNDEGILVWEYGIGEGSQLDIVDNQITENDANGISLYQIDEGCQVLIAENTIGQAQSTTVTGETVGTGDGSSTEFSLGARQIVPRSEIIYLDGTPTTAYTIHFPQARIAFDTAPGLDVAITADYITDGWGISVHGYSLHEGCSLTVRDNRISENDTTGIFIDEIDEGCQAFIEDNTITENGEGILVTEINEGSLFEVTGNRISDNDASGIFIMGSYKGDEHDIYSGAEAVIEGNTISANGGSGCQFAAVEMGSYLAFRDNEINDNIEDGIYLDQIDQGSQVVIGGPGNTISGNDSGIYIAAMENGSSLAVWDNLVTENLQHGVYLETIDLGSEVTVADNLVSGNSGIGLCLGDDSTLTDSMATVRGNTIARNTDWGIYSSVAHSVTSVSGCNQVLSNGGGGIYINGAQLDFVAVNQNSIESNTGDGLRNDSGELLDAANNWWGDASGPGGSGPGSGDAVSGDVDYIPWLTLPCGVTPEPDAPEGPPRPPAAPAPTPADSPGGYRAAAIEVASLDVAPTQVLPNQEILVYVDVYNYGNQAGPYNVILYVDGEPVGGQRVNVPANSYQRAVLTTYHSEVGNHRVTVGSHEGWFSVYQITVPPRPDSGLGGSGLGTGGLIAIIAGGGVAAGLGVFFYTRRREW